MEKIIYLVWRDAQTDSETFAQRLRGEVANQLLALGACGLQVNVVDRQVEAAAGLRQANSQPLMDGSVALWVDSAIAQFRQPFEAVLASAVARLAGYLVSESVPIRNTRFPAVPGERTHGFAQLALLTRPAGQDPATWLDIWHNQHTQVAIDTQDNFLYVQNLVLRPLNADAPKFDAIVEECFPPAAMTDPQAFFDAVGDEAKFQRNLATMMESCQRFIDFDKIDVLPTSQYLLKAATAS
ncbi:EthD domain-containing protein [Pseudomonas sp. 2FG]|uniref:EthD domain-containing protein n=1 Tax=Pseudomonas sp. 2FG TaxID=2502191 RepID=UPI0010F824E4|nr:EthD domain-containing protein [Pseudomonas sp. 2FG]